MKSNSIRSANGYIGSKENLSPKVEAFIKAFVNLKNVPKNYNAYDNDTKRTRFTCHNPIAINKLEHEAMQS